MVVEGTLARLHPETALEAAGYVRVSRKVQAEGHSPEVQRQAIKQLASQEGYALTMIEEDHERGSKVTREGYQKIIQAVRSGTIHAVIVFMHDRWGRDGAEWLTRAREFDRLSVPIISVQEGRDEGGLMRFVRAGMAQYFSEQLAKRVLPMREQAARSGTHMGHTPHLGYKRVYPAWDGRGKRPAGDLVVDEATAWIVRELFDRYTAGGWSLRQLALWLNSEPTVPAPARAHQWGSDAVRSILHNPTYCGLVRFNNKPRGYYERAAPGSAFTVPGRHDALVSVEVWDDAQRRLAAARLRTSYNATTRSTTLATGLLRCAACGAPLVSRRGYPGPQYGNQRGQYKCLARVKGRSTCTASSYRMDLAHAALLAEVRRLRGAPWTPQAVERLVGADGKSQADVATSLQRALDHERELLRRHTRRMSEMEDDPTPEQVVAYREVSAEISTRIRSLEAQLADVTQKAAIIPDLRALHERLTRTELATVVSTLSDQGDDDGLRALLLEVVQSACLVERRPARNSTWLRLEVTWTPDVQMLLDAGLLWLDATPEPPVLPRSVALARARTQRYDAKRRVLDPDYRKRKRTNTLSVTFS